jgi:hypothetical protein
LVSLLGSFLPLISFLPSFPSLPSKVKERLVTQTMEILNLQVYMYIYIYV